MNTTDKQKLTQYNFLLNVLFYALEGLTTLQNLCDNERVAEFVTITQPIYIHLYIAKPLLPYSMYAHQHLWVLGIQTFAIYK